MVNVIIDSSTYGNIVKDERNGEKLVKEIVKDKGKFSICNFRIIRDELRKAKIKQLLEIYDQVVSKNVVLDSSQISNLAGDYFGEYQRKGGRVGRKKILKDFKIVACASIKNCDLIFSDDDRTLKSKNAVEAYRLINLKRGYRTPTFYNYTDLKRRFLIR